MLTSEVFKIENIQPFKIISLIVCAYVHALSCCRYEVFYMINLTCYKMIRIFTYRY